MELSPELAARASRAARLWLTVGPVAVLVGLAAVAVVLTSDHDDSKALTLALIVPVGWAFVAAGLVAWAREPANRIGGLLVLAGFAWLFAAWADANTPVVFAFGQLVFPLAYAVIVHLLLAYPTGRLSSRADAAVAALAYVDATVLRIPWLLFLRLPSDSCPDCPTNPAFVSDRPGLADAVDGLTSVVGVAIVAYVFIVLARRWRAATPRARRVLEPVLASGGSVLLGLAALLVVDLVSPRVADVLQWLVFALLITVPASFLVGLLRTRLATAGVSRLLLETPTTPTPEEAQAGLRRALGDPTLELAYWLPERGVYVDTDGSEVELPPDGEGRMTTVIDYDGRPVAALVHDESLRRERELVDAVVAAARVAIEKDRLQAEVRSRLDELQRERDFVRTVVDSAPAFFCVVDLDGTVMRFNETGARMTGRRDDEDVRGRPFWDVFVAPEEAAGVRERLLAAAAGGGSSEVETELVSASGERLVLAWSSTPLVDAQGRPRLLVSGTDVTERKRQSEELRRERDFSHAVTDTTPSFLVVVDDEGRIADAGVNKACQDAVGRREADLVGERFVHVFIPPAERAAVIEKLAQAASGDPVEHEGPWLGRDGRELWIAWSCYPLRGGGERATFLVCGADITERKRQEAELRASRARIVEAADHERRRLERNLHDGAQQRLVTLSLTLRLVESHLGRDSDAVQLLVGARGELAHALEELRDLARGLHPAVLSDHGLEAALDALASRLPVRVRIHTAVEGRLPEPVEVAAYYVVSEALANVQKYAHATEVTIGVARANGQTVVEVRDDGVGGAVAGTGSGLRGLADRVEALGGTLEVESPPGAGTTVRAVIPTG